jgi:hypothetical protein
MLGFHRFDEEDQEDGQIWDSVEAELEPELEPYRLVIDFLLTALTRWHHLASCYLPEESLWPGRRIDDDQFQRFVAGIQC